MWNRDEYINMPSPIEQELRYFFELSKALIIFDIGSCEGEDAIRYSRLFPQSTVYAVEPLPSNLLLLQKNIKEYRTENIDVVPVALSDRKGISQFYVSSGHPDNIAKNVDWDFGNKSSSLLPPDEHKEVYSWVKFNEVIEVETDTLSNICRQKNIKEIDFIHLDVQGAELQVFQGSGDLLKNTKLIWMEVEAVPLYEKQPLKVDVESFMKEKGFVLIKDTVGSVSGDQLYVNSKYFKNQAFFEAFVECLTLPSEINIIIFSKDRACQLELLLRSIKFFLKDWQTYHPCILYTYSQPEYCAGYERVKSSHAEFIFLCEKDYDNIPFKQQVLNLVRDINPYTVFFVDDNVFCQQLDLESETFQIFKQNKDILCLSLRLSPEINYSYVSNTLSPPPDFKQNLIWKWQDIQANSDWGFPMSLDGHIFRTSEIKPLIAKATEFSSPNFLEERLVNSPIDLPEMICFPKSKIVNIPVNKVQDTHFNRYGDLMNQLDLNREFLEGRNIILKDILDMQILSVHQEIPLRLKHYCRSNISTIVMSVIVLCYNQSDALPRCVESLLEQTFDGFEIIIVNVGSTDNTREVSEQLIKAYPAYPISLINDESSDPDILIAFDRGMAASLGQYKLAITADQVVDSNMLLEHIKIFESEVDKTLLMQLFSQWNKKQLVLASSQSQLIFKFNQSEKILQQNLYDKEERISEAQVENAKLKSQVSELQNEIAAMKTSKFWKLRVRYFSLKRIFKRKV
jgi:FkbM family methyltransferase